MKILHLAIQGFRSFTEAQELDFAGLAPGLYHVAGANLVEPELEGNGAGKSSLFEAVYWVLYGQTSRGLRAGTVKNWHTKTQCAGVLSIDGAAGAMTITRAWNPNTLEVALNDGEDGGPVDQTGLENLVGMSPAAAAYSVFFSQFSPAFIDLKPADQTALFADILRLSIWDTASTTAREQAAQTAAGLAELRELRARYEGQAAELLANDFDGAVRQWEKGRVGRVQQAEVARTAARRAVAEATKARDAAQAGARAFRLVREAADAEARACSVLASERDAIERTLRSLHAGNRTKCPACGQSVSNAHIKAEIAKTAKALDAMNARCDEALSKHDAALRKLAKHRDAEVAFVAAERDLAAAQSDLRAAEDRLAYIKSEENPHKAAAEEAGRRGEELAEQLEQVEGMINEAERDLAAANYWTKTFKEIRLAQIRESLAQLSVEANEVLFQLGLPDWSIEFDVERETKSGTINKNFSIMVRSPHTETAVPWEVWSGGESQRLRLAVSMGFANLVSARAGVRPNVEFWDEPSTWLSESGIQDLLGVLAERARNLGKVIFIADHRALDFGGFAGELMVTKRAEGSTFGWGASSV